MVCVPEWELLNFDLAAESHGPAATDVSNCVIMIKGTFPPKIEFWLFDSTGALVDSKVDI